MMEMLGNKLAGGVKPEVHGSQHNAIDWINGDEKRPDGGFPPPSGPFINNRTYRRLPLRQPDPGPKSNGSHQGLAAPASLTSPDAFVLAANESATNTIRRMTESCAPATKA